MAENESVSLAGEIAVIVRNAPGPFCQASARSVPSEYSSPTSSCRCPNLRAAAFAQLSCQICLRFAHATMDRWLW